MKTLAYYLLLILEAIAALMTFLNMHFAQQDGAYDKATFCLLTLLLMCYLFQDTRNDLRKHLECLDLIKKIKIVEDMTAEFQKNNKL